MPFRNFRVSFIAYALIFGICINEARSQEKVLEVGEELKYELSYGFIKLGYIKFMLSNSRKDNKKQIYNAKIEIKSYPEVPFIKVNQIFETEMELDDDEIFSHKFYETSFKDRSITRTDYRFDYKKELIKINSETDGIVEKKAEQAIKDNTHYRDEISWQYESRLNSFNNKNYNIPVFANAEESSVRYSYNANKTVVNIENCTYDIAVIKMEGTSDYASMFGFKGEFLVLLSDDEARVPVKAYYNSSLGNVVCELISYKKSKWKPPEFVK